MVTVEEAKNILMENTDLSVIVKVEIGKTLNCILAEDIMAPIDLPPYPQAAMDGYAIKFIDRKKKLKIIAEIKAGDNKKITIKEGEAVRIFTGSKIPDGADCIIIQEKSEIHEERLLVKNETAKKYDNIRFPGSQVKKGVSALPKGTRLTPAAIGFLATMGIRQVLVYSIPKVSVIITGNELVAPGAEITGSRIYESNSFSLTAALNEIHISQCEVFRVRDNRKALLSAINKALQTSEIVILSGGISVGKYDLVRDCLHQSGVEELFYKVSQKPGKPLCIGKYVDRKKKKIIFALPGNPAATLVCFYEYVYPAIKKMMGYSRCFLPETKARTLQRISSVADRATFLKGKMEDGGVRSLEGQDSYMLKSFAEANCIIYLPAKKLPLATDNVSLRKGTWVQVHLL